MSNAKRIINHTIKLEGGISAHKNDSGRLTYKGISIYFHPNWEGFPYIIQAIKELDINLSSKQDRKRLNQYLDRHIALKAQLYNFYYENFWMKIKGDNIFSSSIAKNIFDFSVNSGPIDGIKTAQKVAGCLQDGIIGPISIRHINSNTDIYEFILEFNALRLEHYYNDILNRPNKEDFLFGWSNRIMTNLNNDISFDKTSNIYQLTGKKEDYFNKFQKLEKILEECWDDREHTKNLKNNIQNIFEFENR